ncbi:hypothetical protein RND71_026288 [Anisodus tanguticus]|uniref:Uncharacterized protein n=1 Tax=Anisodus tanguticus TaxID=243964 RepID=A0AAE1RN10_9SOLA|nr:hypothetical protein RND71_026288 [Anisodus tanguticus]
MSQQSKCQIPLVGQLSNLLHDLIHLIHGIKTCHYNPPLRAITALFLQLSSNFHETKRAFAEYLSCGISLGGFLMDHMEFSCRGLVMGHISLDSIHRKVKLDDKFSPKGNKKRGENRKKKRKGNIVIALVRFPNPSTEPKLGGGIPLSHDTLHNMVSMLYFFSFVSSYPLMNDTIL